MYVLYFNFVPLLKKSFRFGRFRNNYVNLPAVILIKVTPLSCSMCAVQRDHVSFFAAVLFPMIVHLCKLLMSSTPVARVLITPRSVSRQKVVK